MKKIKRMTAFEWEKKIGKGDFYLSAKKKHINKTKKISFKELILNYYKA